MRRAFFWRRGTVGFSVLLLLLMALLAGCLGLRGPAVPASVGDVRGAVLYENKAPIEGATVRIAELDVSVTTDENGAFVFEGLEYGSYTIEVSKARHITYTESVQLKSSELEVEILLPPEGSMLINGSFNVDREPRENPQGFGPEILYGWRPFGIVGPDTSIEHVAIVERPDTEAGVALRLLGHETDFVGVRSLHMPVEAGVQYTMSAQTYIEELLEPTRFQIFVEWWPAGITSEATSNRIGTARVRGSVLREWVEMKQTLTAPEGVNTATVMIIFHTEGELDKLPAEAYVTDVRFGLAE